MSAEQERNRAFARQARQLAELLTWAADVAENGSPQAVESPVRRIGYSTAEVAEMFGWRKKDGTPSTEPVRKLIHDGKLRARDTGAQYVIPISALDEYLSGSDNPASAAS